MTTTRRYTFTWDGRTPQQLQRLLLIHCTRWHWFADPQVGDDTFSFVVHARDQWWAHRRAMSLATTCLRAVGIPDSEIGAPTWEPLTPHTNRGRHRRR